MVKDQEDDFTTIRDGWTVLKTSEQPVYRNLENQQEDKEWQSDIAEDR